MEYWFKINLKQPYFLADKDYQDYILFNIFRYVDVIDISFMDPPYHSVLALFDSVEKAEEFCRENDFVQSIQRSVDREMLTNRVCAIKK
jgi:hypothetical protein